MTRARVQLAVAAASTLALAGAGPAAAAPSVDVRFSTPAPGTPASIHAQIDYESRDSEGHQRPLRKHTLTFPPGTVFDSGAAGNCQATAQQVQSQGFGACPADSKVGQGTLTAIATKPPASAIGTFHTDLTFFNSSHPKDAPDAESALIVAVSVAGQVQTAFVVPIEGNVATEHSPTVCASPGEQPPCPSGELTVSSVDYTIDARSRTADGRARHLVTTPPTCPSIGRWEVDSLREYRDGTVVRVGGTMQCGEPAGRPAHAGLSVTPRTARRCRARRFEFKAFANAGAPVAGAVVRFANRRAVTDVDGRAAIVARLCRLGERRATVKADGFRKGTAAVRVIR